MDTLKENTLNYFKLTSPGITTLVLLSAFAGAWLGSKGMPLKLSALFWCLLGLGLASSGACVLNNWYDKDIDQLMKRTRLRPLPSGKLNANKALCFGLFLVGLAFLILIIFGNKPIVLLTAVAIFVYNYLYTVLLKRRSYLATEIGGISGSLPPLIGWMAVRDSLEIEALLLFGILFLWQPPHFWSLAIEHREDYTEAKIPTLSVIKGKKSFSLRFLLYLIALIFFSLLPYSGGLTGELYLAGVLILGFLYLVLAYYIFCLKNTSYTTLFIYSVIYLFSILTLLIIDAS